MNQVFRRFAEAVAGTTGTAWMFFAAVAMVAGWAGMGPHFGFSERWQLIADVFYIITFLMVFIIQNTQNRDFKALHLKLDVLLYAADNAHRGLIALHKLADEDLDRLEASLDRLRGHHDIAELIHSLESPPAADAPTSGR